MYLKKLYSQSRFWFLFVTLFAIGQLFINYKNGVEVSPLYHYGMFSLPFRFTPMYQCVEVSINGKKLQTKDFTPNGWDNIVIPVVQFNHQQQWNSDMYNQTIRRLLRLQDSASYVSQVSQHEFDTWYRRRVLRLLTVKDTSAHVQYNVVTYKLQNGRLVR